MQILVLVLVLPLLVLVLDTITKITRTVLYLHGLSEVGSVQGVQTTKMYQHVPRNSDFTKL